ncbi:MAG: uridylate kinase [Anaerolineae bacterium]|nr:uridylate kinase [Anaerolineae bacterium]
MRLFLKLGGSLITDKTREASFLSERMAALAAAIAAARANNPSLQLLIGHGSGSFGHFAARRFGTVAGVQTAEQWAGFAEVGRTARQLNHLVTEALVEAGLPVWPLQPSASAQCADGVLQHLAVEPVQAALEQGLVPLVYGDVTLDAVRGGTIISTEMIFEYLAVRLRPRHVLLLGEVAGVLDADERLIPLITPATLPELTAALGGSHGIDVTGGMASKVQDMVRLAEHVPGLTVHILSGLAPDDVRAALIDPENSPGTRITGF